MSRNRCMSRRGAIAVLVMVSLTVLIGMTALTVDVGYICLSRTEMQNAVDAGALAGASGLAVGDTAATERAIAATGCNAIGREPVVVLSDDVQLGHWEWTARSFTPVAEGEPQQYQANAVRVVGEKLDLPLFFGAVLGVSNTDIVKQAIALCDSGRCRGVWGLEGVLGVGDVITDSFDSRLGPYGDGNRGQNGDICSNQDIRINGDTSIHGDAMYGPGYSFDTSGTSWEVWGVVDDICCPVEAPVVDASGARSVNDNDLIGLTDYGRDPLVGGALRLIEDDNLTLVPGTYYFRSVNIVGQATLTVTGPTHIYVDGNANFAGGGILNVTQDPQNLILYGTGHNFTLAGGTGFYGAVVAPDSNVVLLGNADYYGTLIGRTLDMRGTSSLHVDEAVVADLLGGDGSVSPVLVR